MITRTRFWCQLLLVVAFLGSTLTAGADDPKAKQSKPSSKTAPKAPASGSKTDKGVTIDELSVTLQLPKGLARNTERDSPVKNEKGLYSMSVFFEEPPETEPGMVRRMIDVHGVFFDTEGLTPERKLKQFRTVGGDADAAYSKDSDFKIGEMTTKRLEYREKADDGKGLAHVIYMLVRPGLDINISVAISHADDKTAKAFFRETDQMVAKMKFSAADKEKK